MRRATAALIFVAMLAGCRTQATRDFVFTAPWDDYDRIVVRTIDGRVELASGPMAELRVSGQMRVRGTTEGEARRNLDTLEVVAHPDEASPRTLVVELRVPDALRTHQPGASLSVGVPTPCPADVRTTDGEVAVARLAGPLVLATVDGAIDVRDVAGDVRAETSSGRIEMRAVGGDVWARTSNGGVSLSGVHGNCQVTTTNGAVSIEGATGNIRVDTSNGAIDVTATPPDDGSVVLKTSDASMELTLPQTMQARVTLVAANGFVAADGPGLEIRRQTRERLQGLLAGGGPGTITAETSNGVVRLHLR